MGDRAGTPGETGQQSDKLSATHPNRLEQDELGVFIGQVQGHTSQGQGQLRFYGLVDTCQKVTDLGWREINLISVTKKKRRTIFKGE